MTSEPKVSDVTLANTTLHSVSLVRTVDATSDVGRCVSQIRLLFPRKGFGIRLLLADGRGRLCPAATAGDPIRGGRRHAHARRLTYADRVARIITGRDDRAVGIFAIDRRGSKALGIAEVTSFTIPLERSRWDVEAALGRCASSLRHRTARRDVDLSLAWTAHELRGPIRAAQLWLVNAAAAGSDAGADLDRASAELSRIADEMETLLRWAAGIEKLRPAPVDLVDLASEAASHCVAEAGDDRVLVEGGERLIVRADGVQLRAAVENLIRNALRFSTPGTKINVTVELRDGIPTVEVENEGPGVAHEDRERIFEPLTSTRSGPGSGLGLFVADRIVRQHGGTIRYREPAAGHVAFELRLPRRARR